MTSQISKRPEQTLAIARKFAETVEPGAVICLEGNLGAGKTHFVKGFVKAFGLSPEVVTSPTFTLINEYDGRLPIYHFDCYRLESVEEALEIGAEEYLYGTGVCIIEWPGRIAEIIPEHAVCITIESTSPEEREIIFHGSYPP
jgi:tRNA threonylcarbamoyladenosine biosynthesis protein TsaE